MAHGASTVSFRCKELQTLYLHHNSFTSLPSSLSRDSQSAISAVEPQSKSEVQRGTRRTNCRTKGAGKLARACIGMVQAHIQTNVVVLQRRVVEWYSHRYTTPPLPRVIKGAEWQVRCFIVCCLAPRKV